MPKMFPDIAELTRSLETSGCQGCFIDSAIHQGSGFFLCFESTRLNVVSFSFHPYSVMVTTQLLLCWSSYPHTTFKERKGEEKGEKPINIFQNSSLDMCHWRGPMRPFGDLQIITHWIHFPWYCGEKENYSSRFFWLV